MNRQEHHDMDMDRDTRGGRDYGFLMGLVAGTLVGTGLTLWLAPRSASEIRQRLTDSAQRLGRRASEQYDQAGARVGDTVDHLARKGDEVRDTVADAVERGARKVERYAAAAKSDRGM